MTRQLSSNSNLNGCDGTIGCQMNYSSY